MASIEERVESLIESTVNGLGYELYDVEYAKEGKDYFLRIFIDKEAGIDLNDCEKVNDGINDLLDNYYDETNLQNLYNQTNKQNTNDEIISILKKEKNNFSERKKENEEIQNNHNRDSCYCNDFRTRTPCICCRHLHHHHQQGNLRPQI